MNWILILVNCHGIINSSNHVGVLYILVNPGTHEISFWATAHTDAPGAYSHPAEIMGNSDGSQTDPYNQLIVRVENA